MKTSDFDYDLPPELIAQTPLEPRDASRLLVLNRSSGRIEHRRFRDLVSYMRPGDLLVANDSRVIAARLFGRKLPTGGRVEMLLVKKRSDETWEVLLKPGRRVRPGVQIAIDAGGATMDDLSLALPDQLVAEVVDTTEAGGRMITFSQPIEPLLERIGTIPLPPYVHTPLVNSERYQTIYSRAKGSVAAPTAGLHFTAGLMGQLRELDVGCAFVTLHVSMDTFRPVQEDTVEEHRMYSEYCKLSQETAEVINTARARGHRVFAVGTTSVRVLESAAAHLEHGDDTVAEYCGPTELFIYPGFRFRVVEAMITNFHLPRSSLLMLVAAFAGKDLVERAYHEAIRERYRFYSFGDAMLVL